MLVGGEILRIGFAKDTVCGRYTKVCSQRQERTCVLTLIVEASVGARFRRKH